MVSAHQISLWNLDLEGTTCRAHKHNGASIPIHLTCPWPIDELISTWQRNVLRFRLEVDTM